MADGHVAETAGVWAALSGLVGGALGAFGLWLANRMLGKAAFQTAINAGFQALTDQLQEERAALRQELERERVAHAAQVAQLRGEIINLTQTIEGLKRLLRAHGIAIPMGAPHPDADTPPMLVLEGPALAKEP